MQQGSPPHSRERTALSLACALHAAAFLALWCWALSHGHWRQSYPRRLDEREIELDLESPTPAMQPATSGTAAVLFRHVSPQRLHVGDRLNRSDTADRDARVENGSVPESSLQQPDASRAPARSVDLGLGADAWRMWVRSSGFERDSLGHTPAAERAPRPASSTGGLQEGLEEHDRQVGLGASGPVVGALYRAAHGPVAPEVGVAHFRVTVLKSGSLEVSLSDATDQLPAWRAVASKAAEELRRAPPRIADPRTGARMVIEITAQEVFPNGVKQKELYGPRVEVKAPRFRSVAAAQANLKDLNPLAGESGERLAETKANVDLPGVFVGGKGKVCGYRAGITPLGPLLQGGCDIANLGAKPQRMVHTLVREETLF
jgi:hypothetical protein